MLGAARLFGRDKPCLRSGPAWLLFSAFLSNVAPALRAEPYRLPEGIAELRKLSGSFSEGEGFARQFADRGQALRQILARTLLAPAVSCLNGAMVIAECAAARLKMMSRGPHPESPR